MTSKCWSHGILYHVEHFRWGFSIITWNKNALECIGIYVRFILLFYRQILFGSSLRTVFIALKFFKTCLLCDALLHECFLTSSWWHLPSHIPNDSLSSFLSYFLTEFQQPDPYHIITLSAHSSCPWLYSAIVCPNVPCMHCLTHPHVVKQKKIGTAFSTKFLFYVQL